MKNKFSHKNVLSLWYISNCVILSIQYIFIHYTLIVLRIYAYCVQYCIKICTMYSLFIPTRLDIIIIYVTYCPIIYGKMYSYFFFVCVKAVSSPIENLPLFVQGRKYILKTSKQTKTLVHTKD